MDNYRSPNKLVIVKKGKEGAELWRGYQLIADINAPEVLFVDATGSGDVLAGAFMSLYAEGQDSSHSLALAVKMATKSVTAYGVDHLVRG